MHEISNYPEHIPRWPSKPVEVCMSDSAPVTVVQKLARFHHSFSAPFAAALGSPDEGPVLQVHRIIDAMEIALKFVVAHAVGAARELGEPLQLSLPDHPALNDWISATKRLANITGRGGLKGWG